MEKVRIGILASGSGSNAESIMQNCENGCLKDKASVVILISNKKDAFCLERAKNHKVPTELIESEGYRGTREEYDKLIIKVLEKYKVNLVCMAGFMRLVSPLFLQSFPNRVMNIHPALLPSFPGVHGYKDAIEYGVKITGITVHFVDDKVDHGPIILQKSIDVTFDDTEDTLKEKGLKLEHKTFPEAIELYCLGKLQVIGRKVKILK